MAFTGQQNSSEALGQPQTRSMLRNARKLLRGVITKTGYTSKDKSPFGDDDDEYFVYIWNDQPKRTKGEVIKALQAAAKVVA